MRGRAAREREADNVVASLRQLSQAKSIPDSAQSGKPGSSPSLRESDSAGETTVDRVLHLLRQRRYIALFAIAGVVAVACIVAGIWQVSRYDWKHDENLELRTNDERAVAPVAEVLEPGRDPGEPEKFRRITATGTYDAAGQLLVRQRQVKDGPAMLVITPLRTTDGPVLFVVRGWVRATGPATETPDAPAPPTGQVTVAARVYPSEPHKAVSGLPAKQIERIDVPTLEKRLDVTAYGGYVELIDQDPAQTDLTKLPAPDLSNPAGGAFELQHLAYVVQWFIFAALALIAPWLLMRSEMRRTAHPPVIARSTLN